MNTLHVKRDDTVIVISGDDKGVKGKVIAVSPEERKVIVEGANVQTKHVKPRRQGEAGGIVKAPYNCFPWSSKNACRWIRSIDIDCCF